MKTLVLDLAAGLLAPAQDPPDRVESWLTDLDELARVISERHKNAFFKVSRDAWFKAVEDVRKRIPTLKDHEIAIEFMKLGAMIGDGHTVVRPTALRRYPISCLWLKDGLHIVMASEERRDLLKARVVAVGKTPVDEAARRVGVLSAADNASGARSQSAHWMTIPEALAGVGLIDDMDKAPFTVVDAQGKERVVELAPSEKPKWTLGFAKPDAEMPVWRRGRRSMYGQEAIADRKTLYCWYDSCSNAKDKTVTAWCEEVMAAVDASMPERIVLDLRRNGGGSSILLNPFFAGLRKRPESAARGRLFVLVDRPTYSSALMNAADLRKAFKAVLIGLPPGGALNGYGEVRTLPLPNSRWIVQYSTKYFKLGAEGEDVLKPDLEVEPTAAEFFSGADPALEAAMTYKP